MLKVLESARKVPGLPSPITLVSPVVVATQVPHQPFFLSARLAPFGGRMAPACRRFVNDRGQSAVGH